MISKEQFLSSVLRETGIIKHLFTKIPENAFDYKPTEKQRTTLELLQYITFIGATAIDFFAGNTKAFEDFETKKQTVTRENFVEMLTGEEARISSMFNALTDEQLAEETESFGFTAPRAMHLLNILKWLVAYKMQLFLYIKSNGVDVGTPNLWSGKDMN